MNLISVTGNRPLELEFEFAVLYIWWKMFWYFLDYAYRLVQKSIHNGFNEHVKILRTTDLALKQILFVQSLFSDWFRPSEVNVCYYGTEALSQRTLSPGKDYRNPSKDYKLQTPALYFLNQIRSPLASLSLLLSPSFFLEWMICPEGL